MLTSTNFNQLKKELKPYEGKAIFKLTRSNSMNDGIFFRVLHTIKQNEIVFFDGQQLTYLPIKSAKDIEILNTGFNVGNCSFELIEIKQLLIYN